MVKPLESSVETYLVQRVRALGGRCEKVQVIGRRGFFDRLVVLPGNVVMFVECKRPKGGIVSAHQIERHRHYRDLGAVVAIVLNPEDIDRLLDDQTKRAARGNLRSP
jgi:hypothetical protein